MTLLLKLGHRHAGSIGFVEFTDSIISCFLGFAQNGRSLFTRFLKYIVRTLIKSFILGFKLILKVFNFFLIFFKLKLLTFNCHTALLKVGYNIFKCDIFRRQGFLGIIYDILRKA